MVRKHLHYSAEEWDALPWYRTRAYIEQLNEDLTGGTADGFSEMQ